MIETLDRVGCPGTAMSEPQWMMVVSAGSAAVAPIMMAHTPMMSWIEFILISVLIMCGPVEGITFLVSWWLIRERIYCAVIMIHQP